MVSLTRRAFVALGLAGAGSLLAACQQPTSPSRSAESRTTESKPAEPKPTALIAKPGAEGKPGGGQAAPAPGPPKPGGSMVWVAEADPVDLDPHTSTSFSSMQAWGDLTYQSLVMFDENMKIVPCLAESWKVSDDRLTWTFKLRQGVTFHDGSPFEAEDVTFWFERLTAPETASPYRSWFSPITGVTPKGKYEVELTLNAPYAPFLGTFAALRGSAMVPRRWMQRAGAASRTTAVGSGPFKIVEYVPRSHIRYVKNPDYWENGLPYLDEVRLEIVPDEAQRVEALRSGRVTYAMIGPAAAQRLKRELTVLSSAGPSQARTSFNITRKPFDDVRVRQAIALTVDRQAAIERVLGGEGRLTGPMPTGHGDWSAPPTYPKDLTRAKQLLAEAGYPDGFESTIKTTGASSLLGTSLLLADQLRAIGITLNVEQIEPGALTAALKAREFDVASTAVGFLPDPDSYFSSLYHSHGAQNVSSWTNARYDELVDQARVAMDPGARRALYDEATTIALNDAPHIWWFTENIAEAVPPSLKGYRPSFTGRPLGLKRAWLDR